MVPSLPISVSTTGNRSLMSAPKAARSTHPACRGGSSPGPIEAGMLPLVVAQDHLARRPDDEGRVEPAVRELRDPLHPRAAAGDEEVVLAGFLAQALELRAVQLDGLLHEAVDAVLSLARGRHALQEVLREHHQARRQLPEVAHAEVDEIADALEVALDVIAVLRDVYVRLNDESGVLGNAFHEVSCGNGRALLGGTDALVLRARAR